MPILTEKEKEKYRRRAKNYFDVGIQNYDDLLNLYEHFNLNPYEGYNIHLISLEPRDVYDLFLEKEIFTVCNNTIIKLKSLDTPKILNYRPFSSNLLLVHGVYITDSVIYVGVSPFLIEGKNF